MGADWQRTRARFLNGSGLNVESTTYARDLSDRRRCAHHLVRGERIPGVPVDHIVPRSRRPDLAHDMANLQRLCPPCHDAKTARENGIAPCRDHCSQTRSVGGIVACVYCGAPA